MAAPQRRDWSELLPELIQEIAGHLTEIPDRIRFRCVCVRWRSGTESISRLPRQLPWLLLPTDSFLSFAEKRVYAFPGCHQLFPQHPPLPEVLQDLDIDYIRRANILSPSSSSDDDLVIAATLIRAIVLYRPGETSWELIETPYSLLLKDFAFHGNRLFVFNYKSGVVSLFDIDTAQMMRDIPAVEGYDRHCCIDYLVETPFRELLLVIRKVRDVGDESKMFRFFRLDEMRLEWIKISSIGNNVLFLDGIEGIALDARGLSCCRGNSVYFVDSGKEVVLLFDVEEGRIKEAPISAIKVGPSAIWTDISWVVPTIC